MSLHVLINLCFWWLQMRTRWKVNMAAATAEVSHSVWITITPQSSDISRDSEMRKKKSFSGVVSAGGKFAGLCDCSARVTQLSGITHISVLWEGRRETWKRQGGSLCCTNLACSVPQITKGKRRGKTKGGVGKDSLNLSVNLAPISSTVLKTLVSSPTQRRPTFLCTSFKNEQPFP